MTGRGRVLLLALGLPVFAACGGSNASVTPQAPPKPIPITASVATLDVAAPFSDFKNGLGDQLEAITLTIGTNIPTSFRAKVKVDSPEFIHPGNQRTNACGSGDSCNLHKGDNVLDYWCTKPCTAGAYKVTIDVCSYVDANSDSCKDQTAGYLAFAGNLGANLTGNALAQQDPSHQAILNLHREFAFTSPGYDPVVAAAKTHQKEIKVFYDTAMAAGISEINGGTDTQNIYCQGGSTQLCAEGWDKWMTIVRQVESIFKTAEVPACYAAADQELRAALSDFEASYKTAGVFFGGSSSVYPTATAQRSAGVAHLDKASQDQSSASCP